MDKDLFDRELISHAFYFKWWVKVNLSSLHNVYPGPNLYLPRTLVIVDEEDNIKYAICRYKLKKYEK